MKHDGQMREMLKNLHLKKIPKRKFKKFETYLTFIGVYHYGESMRVRAISVYLWLSDKIHQHFGLFLHLLILHISCWWNSHSDFIIIIKCNLLMPLDVIVVLAPYLCRQPAFDGWCDVNVWEPPWLSQDFVPLPLKHCFLLGHSLQLIHLERWQCTTLET